MRANMLFMAVLVPAGSHEVVLSYEPSDFTLGAAVSIASSAALLTAALTVGLVSRRRMRRG